MSKPPSTTDQTTERPLGPRLSDTDKLGARSWSLEAVDTCPGAFLSKEEKGDLPDKHLLVDACHVCYARNGNYRRPLVKAPREHNREDWRRDEWVEDMIALLWLEHEKKSPDQLYFRWFDSGDMYALPLACKIHEVIARTPWCEHWLPTRMHKFKKFRPILEELDDLPNCHLKTSGDSVMGEFDPITWSAVMSAIYNNRSRDKAFLPFTQTTIIPDVEMYKQDPAHDGADEERQHARLQIAEAIQAHVSEEGFSICPAYKQGGKCLGCRTCWTDADVAYVAHGASSRRLCTQKIDALLEVEYAGIS